MEVKTTATLIGLHINSCFLQDPIKLPGNGLRQFLTPVLGRTKNEDRVTIPEGL